MPVWKYRSIEEMNAAEKERWYPSFDPRSARAFIDICITGFHLGGRYVPPRGVFKFRSIEEANAHREAWERERIALIEARKKMEQPAEGSNSNK